MSQRDQQHVVMPTDPTAHFIMIKTDFAFGFFENCFDGPAHAAEAHELNQGCGGGGIAEIELDFRGSSRLRRMINHISGPGRFFARLR